VAGDQVLVSIAGRLRDSLREGDTVARLGGDEFAVLLENLPTASDATEVADRIHARLKQPLPFAGRDLFTSVSIGIALSHHRYQSPKDILRDADIAMYQAKDHGRDCHVVFDSAMHSKAVALLNLEADIRRAIERGEFRIYYQKIVSLKTDELAGFEALLRWHHPERGLLSPGEFLAVAEESGLIVPLSWWCVGEACRHMQRWLSRLPAEAPYTLSINVASEQFSDRNLIERLSCILNETGLHPSRLTLEMTETIIMENAAVVASKLAQLKTLGVGLQVDDFGTGYSSLSRLRSFPIDTVKIDRCFIEDLGSGDFEFVRAILALARHLGMKIIAEGVETAGQLAAVRTLGCDYAQGYFFSQPVDGETLERQLIARFARA
jgi:predicted signal transduction protein with EAL and GGDEF domain